MPRFAFAPCLLWGIIAQALFCAAWAEQATPPGGAPLLLPDPLASLSFWQGSGEVSHRIVPVSGTGFSSAVEIEVRRSAAEIWDGQLSFPLPTAPAPAAGDVGLLQFWMRTTRSGEESGVGRLQVLVETQGEPYTKSLQLHVSAGPEWVLYSLPFSFADPLPPSGLSLKFAFGQGRPRTVQLGAIQLLNYKRSVVVETLPRTRFSYEGRAADSAWRLEAAARMETHRKGRLALQILAPGGSPIPAEADLNLIRHQFQFSSVFSAKVLLENEIYRNTLVELFNASGPENDLKWPPLEGEWGPSFSPHQTEQALEWLRQRGMALRGHVLVWPGRENLPRRLLQLVDDPARQDSVPDEVLTHIRGTASRYSPWLQEWDVLNEPYTNHLLQDLFRQRSPTLEADWFRAAREAAAPGTSLFLNEYELLSGLGQNTAKHAATIALLRQMLDQGGPVTGLGFQSHFHESALTSIPRVIELLDSFGEQLPELRFRVTEFDVDTSDPELQADYLRDFLTAVFSHPQADGFQFWGFWEGAHWKPAAALFNRDWTPRPQANAYRKLLKEWHSRLQFAANGAPSPQTGFRGTYAGTVKLQRGQVREIHLILPLTTAAADYTIQLPETAPGPEPQWLPAPAPGHIALLFQPGTDPAALPRLEHRPQTGDAGRTEPWPAPLRLGVPNVVILPRPAEGASYHLATP